MNKRKLEKARPLIIITIIVIITTAELGRFLRYFKLGANLNFLKKYILRQNLCSIAFFN